MKQRKKQKYNTGTWRVEGKGDMAKAGMAVVITVTFSKKKKKKKKFCCKPHFGKTSNNNNYTYKNIPFLNYYNGMFIPY